MDNKTKRNDDENVFANKLIEEFTKLGFRVYKDKNHKGEHYKTFKTVDERTNEQKKLSGGKFDLLVFGSLDLPQEIFPLAIELKKGDVSIDVIVEGIVNQVGNQYQQENLYWTCNDENWVRQKPKTLVFCTDDSITKSLMYVSNSHEERNNMAISNFFIDRFCWKFGISTLYGHKDMFILNIPRFKPVKISNKNNIYMVDLATGCFTHHYNLEQDREYANFEEIYLKLKERKKIKDLGITVLDISEFTEIVE